MKSMDDEKPGRTFELWLLALGLLLLSLAGWLRVQFVLSAREFLIQTLVQPGPVYQVFLGMVWGVGGLVCAAALLLRARFAPALTRIMALIMAVWYWVDALALTRDPTARDNWPFMIGVTLFCLVFTFGVLALDRQKQFFS
jgi:hypothetical protein